MLVRKIKIPEESDNELCSSPGILNNKIPDD
jgi:hypothetical protein